MPTNIVVPELGESVVEATVGRWLKQEGETVAAGEAVVELETDKVNLEVSAEKAGVLARIERQEGEDVQIGDVLGVIEPLAETPDGDGAKKAAERAATPAKTAERETGPAPAETAAETKEVPAETMERATPVARRLAEEHGLDLSQVPAGDAGERLTKEDVQRYLEQRQAPAPAPVPAPEGKEKAQEKRAAQPAAAVPAPGPDGRAGREERVRMTRRRRTIAQRLVEVQQTAAILTTFNEVDMSAVMDVRQRRRESFEKRHGIRLGFMSFFVKAAIGALRQFPELNAEIDGDEMVLKHYYDIGMAVSTEEGLVVPVLRGADRMTFAEIEQAVKTYADKARDGNLSLEELRGGTFSITNGGVFGSLLSTPILNPPQVGILGLHKIEQRPVALDGQVVIRPMMYVALSYDHRIVDGREAVQFLVRVKELIEDPETLLLEG